MSVRVHRSEAPIPRIKRYAEREREALEADGQLVLDLEPPAEPEPTEAFS